MQENRTPIKLIGTKHSPIWSGKRLSRMYRSFKDSGIVGESHETSPDAIAVLGEKEIPYSDYLESIGYNAPPLVKFLDAAAPLSVQVHPDERAATKLGGVSKSELWYILESDDGAYILYGTLPEADEDTVKNAVLNGDTEHLLCRIPVKKGDIFMIPPGMIHSLGAGITVLEIQDRAGTTYRIQDIAGNRETHKTESAESVRIYSHSQADSLAVCDLTRMRGIPLPGKPIAATGGFAVSRFESSNKSVTLYTEHKGLYMFCEKGTGVAADIDFEAGESLYFPDIGSTIRLSPNTSVFFVL